MPSTFIWRNNWRASLNSLFFTYPRMIYVNEITSLTGI
uniref:Uncharacterized protein n=1 Tax=Rhizophora mucronata TaxID=61149 RepID=A0A2P2ISR1_RHIMU